MRLSWVDSRGKSTKEEVTNLLKFKTSVLPTLRLHLASLSSKRCESGGHSVACGGSRERIGVVELGIVKNASQITAKERTFRGNVVDYGGRKLTINLK